MMLAIECLLTLLAVLLALIFPTLGTLWFEKLEGGFAALGRRRRLAVIGTGLAALALRAVLLPILPIPKPIVHDEFGYLLAADTFAHGRLTNPTHPMWVSFETFSILQKPTYQCYAQPAQGMILALGRVVFGRPFWGVWLSAGAMCAAICWMLQGWLPPGWALLGGVLAVLRLGVFSYWANSYWGGAAGAIGGALVLGALSRIKRAQRVWDALLMALGLAILANNRPYEGLLFSLPVTVALFAWIFGKQRLPLIVSFRRVLLPLCLLLAVSATATGYYFWRVTGSALRIPYQVERATYAVAPYLIWQPLPPQPVYHDPVIEESYRGEVSAYFFARSPFGFTFNLLRKAVTMWEFFLGPALTLPLLMMVFILPYGFPWQQVSAPTRFWLITLVVYMMGLSVELAIFSPHYAAPTAGLILALALQAMRLLQSWRWRNKSSGRFLTRAIPVICVIMFVVRALAVPLHITLSRSHTPAWYQRGPTEFGRAAILAELTRLPGNQLVIVSYSPDHNAFDEWVYNDADIDAAKVVWAREMSPSEDAELVRYFANRKIWLLEADEKPPRLSPYPLPAGLASAHEGRN